MLERSTASETFGMTATGTEPTVTEGFAARAWRGTSPLLIWAAHFVALYASTEIACELELHRWQLGNVPALAAGLWLLTAAAVAVLAGLSVTGLRNHMRRPDTSSTPDAVHMGAAVLALVGVVWSAVALALAPLCAT